MRLTVGDETQTIPASDESKEVLFNFVLGNGNAQSVMAELIDKSGKRLAGGYYVYCRFQTPSRPGHVVEPGVRIPL